MKIALIHDWFITGGGSEKVVRKMLFALSNYQVDIYTLIDKFSEEDRNYFLHGKQTNTSFIQHFPMIGKYYRYYLPLFPRAIESFNLSDYDLIISSSHSVAKGVKVKKGQMHLCYCHTPMRYLWDMRKSYIADHNLNKGWKKWLAKPVMASIRKWDFKTCDGVTWFLANSENVRQRIQRNYKRDAEVVYPPVNTDFYNLHKDKEDFYVTASRLVPYKRVDLIVQAFREMPGKKLIVIGDGPLYNYIKSLCDVPNIELIRFDTKEVLRYYLQRAKAFIFAAEEDFGITPVEAQSCGTPVIAHGKGGALETIQENKTGMYFHHQTVKSIVNAVYQFENLNHPFLPQDCRENALRFKKENFLINFCNHLKEKAGIECNF